MPAQEMHNWMNTGEATSNLGVLSGAGWLLRGQELVFFFEGDGLGL